MDVCRCRRQCHLWVPPMCSPHAPKHLPAHLPITLHLQLPSPLLQACPVPRIDPHTVSIPKVWCICRRLHVLQLHPCKAVCMHLALACHSFHGLNFSQMAWRSTDSLKRRASAPYVSVNAISTADQLGHICIRLCRCRLDGGAAISGRLWPAVLHDLQWGTVPAALPHQLRKHVCGALPAAVAQQLWSSICGSRTGQHKHQGYVAGRLWPAVHHDSPEAASSGSCRKR